MLHPSNLDLCVMQSNCSQKNACALLTGLVSTDEALWQKLVVEHTDTVMGHWIASHPRGQTPSLLMIMCLVCNVAPALAGPHTSASST
jgi:hypothetical protein